MNRKIIGFLIITASLMMSIPLTQPVARATGPPYSWTGPTDVDSHVGQDNLPAAVQASNGTLWLSWQTFRFTSNRPDIIYRTFTNNVWGSIGRLTSTGYNTSPSMVQLSGTIMLFWSQKKTTSFTIYYESFSGSSWSSQQNATVISTSYDDSAPSLTSTSDGKLWLFWERDNQSCTATCVVAKQVYYKTLISGTWSSETRITSDSNWNSLPSATTTKNGLVRLAWAKGGQGTTSSSIYYKTYNGTIPSADVQVVSPPSGFGDTRPSMIQDRNGTIWLFWARTSLTAPTFVLYNKFSTNNAQTWSGESQMTNEASGIDSQQPAAVQGYGPGDKAIHLFYSSDRTNMDYDIWTFTSPSISPVHDLGITNEFTTPNLYAGGMPSIGDLPITTISVSIANYGDFGENAQATVIVSNTTNTSLGSQTQPIAMGAPGAPQIWTFTFSWNTTSVKAARYNIQISLASTNSTETPGNQGDNALGLKNNIHLYPWGDIDQDGAVTLQDVSVCFFDFGFTPATPSRWNPFCDINNNGIIDIIDAGISVHNFGIST